MQSNIFFKSLQPKTFPGYRCVLIFEMVIAIDNCNFIKRLKKSKEYKNEMPFEFMINTSRNQTCPCEC